MEKQEKIMMKLILALSVVIFLITSCTYSITMVHTQGHATDIVDDQDTITPTTDISVPVSALK